MLMKGGLGRNGVVLAVAVAVVVVVVAEDDAMLIAWWWGFGGLNGFEDRGMCEWCSRSPLEMEDKTFKRCRAKT